MAEPSSNYGLLAQFANAADTLHAAAMVRDAGYTRWDVFTSYPVHGMDQAMGLRKSQVGWFTFIFGATGFTLAMLMIWWMNAYDYPLVVGGKPLFSPLAAFPISYESTILLAAFGSLGGMLILNRLPRFYHPLFNNERFKQAMHDGFFIVIEASDPRFSGVETRKLLAAAGSTQIEEVGE